LALWLIDLLALWLFDLLALWLFEMAFFEIDLHAHTTASDGAFSPTQLVELAVERGLTTLGITDHDTIDGLPEAMAAGQRLNVEVVPGVEFSLRHETAKQFIGLHLLGYFINPQTPELVKALAKVRQGRIEQKIKQIEKLQSFGFDLPVEEVLARAAGVPGRPHIAAVLLERNPGKFTDIQQIFDEYLGAHAKAHVGRDFALTLAQAVAIIKAAGGAPVLAHPGVYESRADPITVVRNATAEGIVGVEVFYPYNRGHRPTAERSGWIARIEALAKELKLLKTGGSDFHGRSHDIIELGDMGLTKSQYAAFKQGWQKLAAEGRTP
jgi:predicted metal-dependent phosphoesterase TrpH